MWVSKWRWIIVSKRIHNKIMNDEKWTNFGWKRRKIIREMKLSNLSLTRRLFVYFNKCTCNWEYLLAVAIRHNKLWFCLRMVFIVHTREIIVSPNRRSQICKMFQISRRSPFEFSSLCLIPMLLNASMLHHNVSDSQMGGERDGVR